MEYGCKEAERDVEDAYHEFLYYVKKYPDPFTAYIRASILGFRVAETAVRLVDAEIKSRTNAHSSKKCSGVAASKAAYNEL